MALVVKDRVQESSTTTGTGTLTLSGALTGFQTFSGAIGNGNTTYYAITLNGEWEVGIGTVGSGTLTRDTVLESSNGGSLVNFSAGTKNVFCTYPAEKSVDIDTSQTLANKTFTSSIPINGSTSGSVTLQAPAVAGTTTLTLPATSGTVLTNASSVVASQLPAGSVLQVLSTAKKDVFSVASSTFTDVTGMSISITPRSTSSKILVIVDAQIANSGADATMIKLVRNSTDIFIGDAAGSRIRTSTSKSFTSNGIESGSIVFLDSPSSTSSTTYKIQMRVWTGTAYLNRSGADNDNGAHPRAASSITVMEIQG